MDPLFKNKKLILYSFFKLELSNSIYGFLIL